MHGVSGFNGHFKINTSRNGSVGQGYRTVMAAREFHRGGSECHLEEEAQSHIQMQQDGGGTADI